MEKVNKESTVRVSALSYTSRLSAKTKEGKTGSGNGNHVCQQDTLLLNPLLMYLFTYLHVNWHMAHAAQLNGDICFTLQNLGFKEQKISQK